MTTPVVTLDAPAARFLHPSNLLTYGTMLAGLAAVVAAHRLGSPGLPGALLTLAVLTDTFDGRFARLFDRAPAIRAVGAQLDALSDTVAFGVAPVLVLYLLTGPVTWPWWLAAGAYVLSAQTRLGVYNVRAESGPGPDAPFVGIPTPMAGLIVSSALAIGLGSLGGAVVLAACAVAMICGMRIRRPGAIGLAVFALWALAVLAIHARTLMS